MANCQYYFSNVINDTYFHNSVSLFLKEVYDIMKNCYGPYGSHILINGTVRSEATKDGKTILSKVKTNGTISTSVHNSIMSVADKQVYEVGDGSTTTILLLCKLYESFRKIINEHNVSPSVFNGKLETVINLIIDKVKANADRIVDQEGNIDFDRLYNAIYTSVDADSSLAEVITQMFKELNCVDPLVLIEMSPTESHSYELVKGLEVDGTIVRPDIFFNGYSRQEYENPQIVVVNGRLDLNLELFCDLSDYALRNNKDIIFLATGINESVLENVVNINNINPGRFNRIAVFQIKQTALNDEFLDICAGLGANPIDSESLKNVINTNALLRQINANAGSCAKALITEFCARFNDPYSNEDAIKQRIDIINEKIEALEKDSGAYNDRIIDLEDRKAFLSRHYAKFYVGGASPQRKAINYELANDGIPQAISCMKHGVVRGCNQFISKTIANMYYDGIFKDSIEKEIASAILSAYKALTYQIFENKDESIDKNEIDIRLGGDYFINIRDNDNVETINSADTDRAILENATDMAALLATSKGFISQNTEFDVVNKGYQER